VQTGKGLTGEDRKRRKREREGGEPTVAKSMQDQLPSSDLEYEKTLHRLNEEPGLRRGEKKKPAEDKKTGKSRSAVGDFPACHGGIVTASQGRTRGMMY